MSKNTLPLFIQSNQYYNLNFEESGLCYVNEIGMIFSCDNNVEYSDFNGTPLTRQQFEAKVDDMLYIENNSLQNYK